MTAFLCNIDIPVDEKDSQEASKESGKRKLSIAKQTQMSVVKYKVASTIVWHQHTKRQDQKKHSQIEQVCVKSSTATFPNQV